MTPGSGLTRQTVSARKLWSLPNRHAILRRDLEADNRNHSMCWFSRALPKGSFETGDCRAGVSFLVQNETPLEIIKRWIGHGSEEMIRRYTHLRPTDRQDVMSRLPVVFPVCPGPESHVTM